MKLLIDFLARATANSATAIEHFLTNCQSDFLEMSTPDYPG